MKIDAIYAVDSLDALKDWLLQQNVEELRHRLYAEFVVFATYTNVTEWNRAVRLCECLAIVGWGDKEPVEAIRAKWFNGNPETAFYNKNGHGRFVSAIWSRRKNGYTMEQGRTSYYASPDFPQDVTVLWDYPAREWVVDGALASQRNWVAKNPVVIRRILSNCYENSYLVLKSVLEGLGAALNGKMQAEKYGLAVESIVLYLNVSYQGQSKYSDHVIHDSVKCNYIIADGHMKLNSNDCNTTLAKMFTKKEIEKNGYWMHNRIEYGPFSATRGKIKVDIYFEKEFSQQDHATQREIIVQYCTTALETVVEKLKKKKVEYDLDLMLVDFRRIAADWLEGEKSVEAVA